MTEKGFRVLEAIDSKYPSLIKLVVSSQDKNIDNDFYAEIKTYCLKNQIKFIDRKELEIISSQYILAVSWRWLIRSESKIIVFHDSLLPKYRGFSPLVFALINREKEVGVTALFADNEYDKGHIIAQSVLKVSYPIKIQQAINLIVGHYQHLALKIAKMIHMNEEIKSVAQNEALATYSLWRDEEDYQIDWTQSATYIKGFIDALGYPYKGAKTIEQGISLRILDALVVDDVKIENRMVGKVIFMHDEQPVVVCGEGLLRLTHVVDSAGKSVLPFKKFRLRFK